MRGPAGIPRRVIGASVLGVLLFSTLSLSSPAAAAVTLPPGFTDTLVASVGSPTDIAFTPDGRMLITTQPGKLRVVTGGALLPTAALDLAATGDLCSDHERGLLGVAVDPGFASNGYIYLFWTFKKYGVCPSNNPQAPVNRVSRFTLSPPPENTVNPTTESVVIDNIPSPQGNHNAGDLAVAADGLLYVTVGDGYCKLGDATKCAAQDDNARYLDTLLGKVLRVGLDGSIPPDNPYVNANGARRCGGPGGVPDGTGPCTETFASGLRNPFRFAFRPGTSDFFINDVGQNTWEEIDLGLAGADYGWNVREGNCALGSTSNCGTPPAGMTNPIHAYPHSSNCQAITGGAFVPAGIWPSEFDGAYMFSDYVCGKIFRLVANPGGGYNQVEFATGLGGSSAVAMAFGPYGSAQALYYTTYAGGGSVRRIAYTGPANGRPTAVLTANPAFGPAPLPVELDGSGSSDPDGDPLTYHWDFGDGSPIASGSDPMVPHTYEAEGSYRAALFVDDGLSGVSDTVTVQIAVGNTPPTPSISSPTTSARFAVDQLIKLTGSATDTQDGDLADAALSWTVLVHHGSHTHPFLGPVDGNNITFNAPPPEDLAATTNSFLEIRLTATDSGALSTTVSQDLRPHRVNVKFATAPVNLKLSVNGTSFTAPKTFTSWEGWTLNVVAANQKKNGRNYRFVSWSDGGAASHAITTPASAKTYTATFRRR